MFGTRSQGRLRHGRGLIMPIGWLAVLLSGHDAARAQRADSLKAVELAPLVVTAERGPAPLVGSTAAVTRVTAADLRVLPVRTVAEALETVPGITFLDVDGAGFDPQLTVRGFYGGGEAEYVQVLLDGRPLNGLESGLVDWDMVPLSALAAIEVVRGGASSLYGDAAVGGVINLVTAGGAGAQPHALRASAGAGSLGLWRGTLQIQGTAGARPVSGFGSWRRAAGFRNHSARTAATAGGSLELWRGGGGSLSLSTLHHWRRYEEPGPLTAAELAARRTAVAPFYRFDDAEERAHRVALDAHGLLGGSAQVSGYLAGELRALDAFRTLPLSPEFADTKDRVLRTLRLLGSAQVRYGDGRLPAGGALLAGADWSLGRLRNSHYQVLAGAAGEYQHAQPGRGALDARGQGTRLAVGGFARYELRPGAGVRITAGARWDWLRDSFAAEGSAAGAELENAHVALSPQAGINLRWLRTATQEGNVFASIGRSFKAPTPDQLFDQRSIPLPVEPYRLTLSNPDLEPARGTSIEGGLYHRVRLTATSTASLSLAAYQLDMTDELDVDLQTYRYVNIGRSRHRGIEAGIAADGPHGLGAFASYTLQAATFRYGEYQGNALKAIPRHALATGIRARSSTGPAASLSAHTVRGVWLDDANTITLPGYTRVDARLSCPFGRLSLDAEVHNLFAAEYSTTGFPDPSGTGQVYYYPAAGRVLQVGITADW